MIHASITDTLNKENYHLLNHFYVPGTVLSMSHGWFNPHRHFHYSYFHKRKLRQESLYLHTRILLRSPTLKKRNQEINGGNLTTESAVFPCRLHALS